MGGKKPNRLGNDVFLFNFKKTEIVPYCIAPNYINSGCSKSYGSGSCCAARIMRDGWKISDNYPW